ncbi:diguanylate cyclase/phosphodiesterase (GGDEF & EAL domains) with PAS/PAC sensor(s) [hydrothermal vent metagenome]|uniref:Diguanylate cyclase/phosphodiesterase (GGDEF & EAL domains) with PAS/PAC sensor(S) n=1 Tax=hydrothermal vent metagenome TaxID=652676 RepID=A0A3B0SWI6_9ZZZZ
MSETVFNFSPWRQTGILSAIATLSSFAITGALYLVAFGLDDRFWQALTLALVVPWGISIPLSLYMAKQRTKLIGITQRLQSAQCELRQVNKNLEYKASYDVMTGLPNREAFFNRIDEKRRQRDNNILMIIDVDHFKNINDSFGHPIGDQALILLAKVFRRILRKEDLVGRIGGEEFGVLLSDTSDAEGQIIGEMIRHEIENTVFEPHKGVRHVITVSIGLTSAAPYHERALLMRNADTALFEAKRRGRNRVISFEPGMQAKPRPFYDTAMTEAALSARNSPLSGTRAVWPVI